MIDAASSLRLSRSPDEQILYRLGFFGESVSSPPRLPSFRE